MRAIAQISADRLPRNWKKPCRWNAADRHDPRQSRDLPGGVCPQGMRDLG
jgi:hypothetical protein